MVVGGGIADDTQHHGICSLGNLRLHDAGCVRKFIRVKGQENEGSTATVGWKLEEVAKDTPRQSDDVSSACSPSGFIDGGRIVGDRSM